MKQSKWVDRKKFVEKLIPDLLYDQGPWESYQALCLYAKTLLSVHTLFL